MTLRRCNLQTESVQRSAGQRLRLVPCDGSCTCSSMLPFTQQNPLQLVFTGARMNRKFVIAGALAAVAFAAGSAQAQRTSRRMPVVNDTPAPSISPYAGYMIFGDIVDGPLGTSLTSSSGSVFGLQANLPLGPTVSVVGNVGYSEPDLRFGV